MFHFMLNNSKSNSKSNIYSENNKQLLKETHANFLRNLNEKPQDYYMNKKNRILFLSLFDSST